MTNTPIPDWALEAAATMNSRTVSTAREDAQIIADAHSRATQVLTCVYCGHAYPPGTPAHGSPILTAHIKTCDKHPLGAVRRALVGLVGVDTAEELDQMEAVMRLAPAPDADKVPILNAIHALRSTL